MESRPLPETGIATSVIKTGDTLRVDGDTGVVTIIEESWITEKTLFP